MHFGFSYVGLVLMIMLFVPNAFWTKNQPKDYEKYVVKENKVLLAFERAGQMLVTTAALIFSDFNLRPWSLWSLWLVGAFLLMILYEIHWILGISTVILGIGHIGIHAMHQKEVEKDLSEKKGERE